MTAVELPAPVARPALPAPVDTPALAAALAARVDGEVRFDDGSRAVYATDASNFRQVQIAARRATGGPTAGPSSGPRTGASGSASAGLFAVAAGG